MRRRLEFIDILVAIGFVATIYGGYALYMASYGGVATASLSAPRAVHIPVRASLQTAMGHAIVERAILDQEFSDAVQDGARKLAQATFAWEKRTKNDGLATIEAQAAQFRAEYAGTVQYVLGKTIVNLSSQGFRHGLLTPHTLDRSPFHTRIIATTRAMKEAAESQFNKTWQPRLGQWIVDTATKERRVVQRIQERIGRATVVLAHAQHLYMTKRAAIDTQFRALASAADRVDRQTDTIARMVRADAGIQQALGLSTLGASNAAALRTWPEIPFSIFVLAFGGLVAIFFIGLAIPGKHRTSPDVAARIAQVTKEIYRKTG